MVNITDLLVACTQAPRKTGPITLVTFCVQIVTENGTWIARLNNLFLISASVMMNHCHYKPLIMTVMHHGDRRNQEKVAKT